MSDWTEAEFTQLVNATLKQLHSVLALARSPLAQSPLVRPLLVLDDVSPTADERGQALRLLLQWAIEQLAPGPVAYPLGEYRPPDDPTWRDPPWWRYNILRHRYLEPIHPDEFVEGGRVTETLLALTGIPSPDTFFDERNRAIREVAQWLRQQMQGGQADVELRALALAEATRPLEAHPVAGALLGIAATFDDVFPRALLLQMAAAEHLPKGAEALEFLTQHRFLQVGDEAQNLSLAPVLRAYLYQRQSRANLLVRHGRAAAYFQAERLPLPAARHLQAAQRWPEAAALLLAHAGELVNELQVDELIQCLAACKRTHLPPVQWRDVQILLSDLYRAAGRQAEALAACRLALKATDDPACQARIYRRMGKLYEQHNQLHALGYYQHAVERFAAARAETSTPVDPEFVELLKDRAWLHILRQAWTEAEADLTQALALAPPAPGELHADIEDALASLYRHLQRYDQAIAHARAALARREELGDLLRVAKSCNNLGLIYNDMGDYRNAIAAYREAIATYATLGNRELMAGALLNIGMAHHLDGRLPSAVQAYQECLAVCHQIGLPLVEARAHSNLVEALAEQGEAEAARRHWQIGFELSRAAGFDDELVYYRQLLRLFPVLQPAGDDLAADAEASAAAASPHAQTPIEGLPAASTQTTPDEQACLDLARRLGRLTPRQLIDALGVSKATATRRLAELAARGALQRYGEGRGTYYTLPSAAEPPATVLSPQPGEGRPPAADAIRPRLYQQMPHLPSAFAVAALGVIEAGEGPLRLAVRFATPPSLDDFFRLETELGRLLGQAVDLMPESALTSAAAPGEAMPAVRWVWQRQDFQG